MAGTNDNNPSGSSEKAKAVVVNPNKGKKGKSKKMIIILVVILLIAGIAAGVWYLLQPPNLEDEIANLPSVEQTDREPTEEPTPTDEPVELSELQIEVLNGTGITGEAGYLQGELEDLGYEDIEVGNADDQDYDEAVVYFSDDVPESIREGLLEELEDIYIDVREDVDDSLEFDIRIITGPRRNAPPTSTTAPSPTSATATDSASTQ